MPSSEQWAWRRVRSLRVFYNHATVYVIANFIDPC